MNDQEEVEKNKFNKKIKSKIEVKHIIPRFKNFKQNLKMKEETLHFN
jgi:hypothetical protein